MIIHDMTMDHYLRHPAIGSNAFKMILQSPKDFKANLSAPKFDTKATALGTAADMALLEPHLFKREYVIQPEDWGPKNVGTKEKPAGKQKWEAFKKENAGKKIIDFATAMQIQKIMDEAASHKGLQTLLEHGNSQVTSISQIESNVNTKARADLLCTDGMIWDLKTTSKGMDDKSLYWTIMNMGYHFSAAHYIRTFEEHIPIIGFGWIFVSTDLPAVHIRIVKASQELLEAGKRDFNYAIALLKGCLMSGEWYGYSDEITEISRPD